MRRSNTCVSSIVVLAIASTVFAAETASALDIGAGVGGGLGGSIGGAVGGLAGGLGASIEGSIGGGSTSVGGSISAGGLDADAGASVGNSGASAGGSLSGGAGGVGGGSATLGGSSDSKGAGTGGISSAAAGESASPQAGGRKTGSRSARTTSAEARSSASAAGNELASELVMLPSSLVPRDDSGSGGTAWMSASVEEATGSLVPLAGKLGTSHKVVDACHAALTSAALPYGAVAVEVVSAGKGTKTKGGGLAAPLEARVVYSVNGRRQVRQAHVSCRLDAAGQVAGL